MTLYRKPKTKFWYYDFRLGGQRYARSTYATNKRDAARIEEAAKAAIRERLSRASNALEDMTFDEAAGRWWQEVGQHRAKPRELFRQVQWLVDALGPGTRLADITTNRMAAIVAQRRGDTAHSGGHKPRRADQGKPAKRVSNATVNRTVTEHARGIMLRARDVWNVPLPQMPAWKNLTLSEPQERIREASASEEVAMLMAIREDARAPLMFAFASGCRLAEIIGLTWPAVHWDEGHIIIHGKGDRKRRIPITREISAILRPLIGNHAHIVFTYVSIRANKSRGVARGEHLPWTYNGLKTRWRRDVREAGLDIGVVDFRLHDTRHTAATRLLRATGNLKIVQQLLGHTTISTTARYAHADLSDLAGGMAAAEDAKRQKARPRRARRLRS
ncbi:tyrosine-type recombinase/integrase [Breoghania sp.]|uniref:site-specific integrase n=1 Tax=Breoghania sp. TaxID=2065378 RepID=UPI002AAC2387|nr:tyrosine-type recombinase/integrase [Breoghania sp.]